MTELKGFLADDAEGEATNAPLPDETPAEAVVEAPAAEAAVEATAPETEEVADDVRGLRAAVSAVRKERADYKGQAERLAGEMAALKAQLDELKKAPPPPPAAAAPAPKPADVVPDQYEDPAGFARYQAQVEANNAAFNTRLELTEDLLRDKEGDEAVDKARATFIEMVKANPALGAELRTQRNPYRWMFNQVKRAEAAKDIGDDPGAWKEAERARIRAELEAELGAAPAVAPAPAAQAVVLPTSLAGVRTAAARSPGVEAPPEFDAIFDRRKR